MAVWMNEFIVLYNIRNNKYNIINIMYLRNNVNVNGLFSQ